MYNDKTFKKIITFIIYDGIKNSVFISQVLQPLLRLLNENKKLEINLISFEKKRPTNESLMKLIPAHNRLHFILCRKLPFFGITSLLFSSYQLKKILKIIKTDEVITRGPLAGWISLKVLNKSSKNLLRKKSKKIIIQARGLLAEEYRFIKQNSKKNFFKKIIQNFIYKKLKKIEKSVYKKNKNSFITKKIEVVSPALKKYLIQNFNSNSKNIFISTKDTPSKITYEEKNKWRKKIRNKLGIKNNQKIYCYSGSYKPWQCIPNIIEYFCKQYEKNTECFLLLLSPDKEALTKLLQIKKVPFTNFKVLSINPNETYKYLAASDIGLLFRDKDIINWVSRPTKMLEYQAVGLKIIHNKTIALLS